MQISELADRLGVSTSTVRSYERIGLDCAVGEVPCLQANDDQGFEIDEAEVIYWGRCPDCRNASRTINEKHNKRYRGGPRAPTSPS